MIVQIETPQSAGPSTGFGTKVLTADGHAIHGVTAIDLSIRPDKVTVASIEVRSAFKGRANAEFYTEDPLRGGLKQVKRIEFTDGSFWDAEADA